MLLEVEGSSLDVNMCASIQIHASDYNQNKHESGSNMNHFTHQTRVNVFKIKYTSTKVNSTDQKLPLQKYQK